MAKPTSREEQISVRSGAGVGEVQIDDARADQRRPNVLPWLVLLVAVVVLVVVGVLLMAHPPSSAPANTTPGNAQPQPS